VNLQRSGSRILASILWSLAFSALLASLAACSTLSKADETSTAPSPSIVPTKASTPTRRPSPTVMVVHTSVPTRTTPTKTVTPPITPSPTQPLSSDSPYLAYLKGEGESQQLILRDQDSIGALSIPVPPSSTIGLTTSISPDGQWLAFCSGRPQPYTYEGISSGPYDLSLYLMRLPDGTIKKVTGLLSPDYPSNFERQAELLNKALTETLTPQPDFSEVSSSGLQQEFGGLCAFDWSHDGSKLAFSGEMDGPSWDLYVYDMKSGRISRISSGLENVVGVSWSPRDDYILHWSAIAACEGGCERWWIAPMNGGEIRELLSPPGNSSIGWTSDIVYTVYTNANGLGSGYINDLDVLTNKVTSVWPHQFDDYATDPATGIVGVGVSLADVDNFLPGFYLYNPQNGDLKKVLDGTTWYVEYWGNGEFSFLVTSGETANVAVRPDGTYKELGGNLSWNSVSPDKRWVAMWGAAHDRPEVKLYTPDGQMLLVSMDKALGIIWRLDSEGFYYISEDSLYYVPIGDPHPQLVDTGISSPYFVFPAWVP
jgi:hypothetical protein